MKRTLGLVLFWGSLLLWVFALSLPWLVDADAISLAAWVTVLLIVSEIMFAVSLYLLGRPFYEAVKQWFILFWRKITGKQPAS